MVYGRYANGIRTVYVRYTNGNIRTVYEWYTYGIRMVIYERYTNGIRTVYRMFTAANKTIDEPRQVDTVNPVDNEASREVDGITQVFNLVSMFI